jgi:hypothetical protein
LKLFSGQPDCYRSALSCVWILERKKDYPSPMADRRFLFIEPGAWVRHPACPEWGLGQVQSVIAERITVNFEDAGKRLINARLVSLELVDD